MNSINANIFIMFIFVFVLLMLASLGRCSNTKQIKELIKQECGR